MPEVKEDGAAYQVDRMRLKLDCLLKEAELLQSEMDARLERHGQSFYIYVALMAGVLSAAAAALVAAAAAQSPSPAIAFVINATCLALLFLPWLTTPLAAMFFDDELLRGVTDIHLHQRIGPAIRDLLRNVGCDATDVFFHTLESRFSYLREFPEKCGYRISHPRVAAYVRQLLFFVPFAIVVVAFWALAVRLGAHHLFTSYEYAGPSLIAVLVDLVLLFALLRMWLNAHELWRRIQRGETPAIRCHLDQAPISANRILWIYPPIR